MSAIAAAREATTLAQLQRRWAQLGQPQRFVGPTEQELLDLSDPRNFRRGEAAQRARINNMTKAVKREEQALLACVHHEALRACVHHEAHAHVLITRRTSAHYEVHHACVHACMRCGGGGSSVGGGGGVVVVVASSWWW